MTAAAAATGDTHDDEAAALMARYGITRVPADTYHLGEWRYSNLRDAVAQARKIAGSTPQSGHQKE